MTPERKKALVEDIISGIVCSRVWDLEQVANPEISECAAKLEEHLQIVDQLIPPGLMVELEHAIYRYAGAYERAALLNGIHVADALRDVAARPSDYAELIGEKLRPLGIEA